MPHRKIFKSRQKHTLQIYPRKNGTLISNYIQHEGVSCAFENADSWIVLTPIEQSIKRKIEAAGTPLRDWDIQINYGIKTGFNEAFIISGEKRQEILSNCKTEDERKRTDELIRPILKDKSIAKYSTKWDGRYLINFHNGYIDINKKKVNSCSPEDYPTIVNYIDSVVKNIKLGNSFRKGGHKRSNNSFENRTDRGISIYNLRNCAYISSFYQKKIIWKQTSIDQTFTFDDSGYFLDVSGQFLTSKSLTKTDFKFLLTILNSKIILWYLQNLAVKFGGKGIRWTPNVILKLPIPKIEKTYPNNLLSLVDNQISNKVDLSKEIDSLIYQFYSLTKEEIEIINNNVL